MIRGPSGATIGTISTTPLVEYETLRVTSSVQDNVNHGDRWCQFRIRFWRDEPPTVNPFRDYAEFTDAEDTCCDVDQPPMLVLEYVP